MPRVIWIVLLFATGATAQVVPERVFFDVPAHIAVNPNPAPSAQLAAVPGYPADANRLTLIALLYRPNALAHGPGPYPTVIVLHGSGGMWPSDAIAANAKTPLERWGQRLAVVASSCSCRTALIRVASPVDTPTAARIMIPPSTTRCARPITNARRMSWPR